VVFDVPCALPTRRSFRASRSSTARCKSQTLKRERRRLLRGHTYVKLTNVTLCGDRPDVGLLMFGLTDSRDKIVVKNSLARPITRRGDRA